MGVSKTPSSSLCPVVIIIIIIIFFFCCLFLFFFFFFSGSLFIAFFPSTLKDKHNKILLLENWPQSDCLRKSYQVKGLFNFSLESLK